MEINKFMISNQAIEFVSTKYLIAIEDIRKERNMARLILQTLFKLTKNKLDSMRLCFLLRSVDKIKRIPERKMHRARATAGF